MAGTEFGEETDPYEQRQEQADEVIAWLEGKRDPRRPHNGPNPNPKNPSLKIGIEVGEKPKPLAPGEIREGPGLHVYTAEDERNRSSFNDPYWTRTRR
jgi:hypothetical protein